MQRTQIILEQKHYELLKKLSESERKSMSQVIRDILDSYSDRSGVFSLSSIGGIVEDTEVQGRNHDEWLYRKK